MHPASAFAAALLMAAGTAYSAQPANQPTDQPPVSNEGQAESGQAATNQAAVNQAVVVSVKGSVRVQTQQDGAFVPVTVGRLLPVGAHVKTGLNSSVTLRIGEGQLFTIESIASVTLSEAIRKSRASAEAGEATEATESTGETDRTVLGVDYGRVLFKIDSSVVANDVTIETPDSTLDVDGTEGGIEVAGRRVRAFGAETNTGSFTVRYDDSGQAATINDNSETDAENPNPADKATTRTRTETGGAEARTDSENNAANRSAGGAQPVRSAVGLPSGPPPPRDPNEQLEDSVGGDVDLPNLPGGGGSGGGGSGGNGGNSGNGGSGGGGDNGNGGGGDPGGGDGGGGSDGGDGGNGGAAPIDPNTFLFLDFVSRELISADRSATDFNPTLLLDNVPGLQTPSGGLAARQIGDGLVEVYHINSNFDFDPMNGATSAPVNRLYRTVYNADGTGTVPQFQLIGTFRDTAQDTLIGGLAGIGDSLYGTAIELSANDGLRDPFIIVRLDVGNESIERVASFGIELEDAIAATDKGTLWVAGERLGDRPPTNQLLGDVIFIEFDPRNRLIVNAFDGAQGGLGIAPGANIDPAIDLDDLMDDGDPGNDGEAGTGGLGFAFLNGQIIAGVDNATTANNGTAGLFFFDAAPGLAPSAPRFVQASVIGEGIPIGLTAIAPPGMAPPPVSLSNPGPMGIDNTSIDPLFAGVAYNQVALDSGVIETIFTDTFIRTAQDPMGCATSSLISMIPAALQNRVNQESGIGRATFDLRDGLGSEHPCFGAQGSSPESPEV